jgi:hypothetical protein
MRTRGFQLRTVVVGDEPDAWSRAGFAMNGRSTTIGSTTIVCEPDSGDGITGVHIDGLVAPIDGLTILGTDHPSAHAADSPLTHTNHVTGFDHLVAMTPAIDRTSEALAAAGLDKRRTREFAVGDETRRQDFFWLGDVILELVGVVGADEPGPASFWGLALECDDLDAAASSLGDGLGRIKAAVQAGRRIATVKTRDLGVSVPIALMSPHGSP